MRLEDIRETPRFNANNSAVASIVTDRHISIEIELRFVIHFHLLMTIVMCFILCVSLFFYG